VQASIMFRETAPELYREMRELTHSIDKSCLHKSLLNLVYLRASQINGCAHFIDMHAKECRPTASLSSVFSALCFSSAR
jgi:AhpD family alkylhydroperoxidase